MNRYTYGKNHGIAMHADQSQAYSELDPITSISLNLGSFLLVCCKPRSHKKKGPKPARPHMVIYQPPNSILIMSGKFQACFFHGVPTWTDMQSLAQCRNDGDSVRWSLGQEPIKVVWTRDSRQRMIKEIERLKTLDLHDPENARWNVTLRWCRTHFGPNCPIGESQRSGQSEICVTLKPVSFGATGSVKSASSEIIVGGNQLQEKPRMAAAQMLALPAPSWDANLARQSKVNVVTAAQVAEKQPGEERDPIFLDLLKASTELLVSQELRHGLAVLTGPSNVRILVSDEHCVVLKPNKCIRQQT